MVLTFEGLDYTGKSSTISELLKINDYQVLRFPDDSNLAVVNAAFSNKDKKITAAMMLLSTFYGISEYYLSDRYRKSTLILDRSFLSCFAYNCTTRQDIRDAFTILRDLHDNNPIITTIDYIFYYECDNDTLLKRYHSRPVSNLDYKSRFDSEVVDKYNEYKERYDYALELYEKYFDETTIIRIDTSDNKSTIEDTVKIVLNAIR